MTRTSKLLPERLYFRIGDVAAIVGVKPHVLRYWETEFPGVTPDKSASGQRVYHRSDVEALLLIKRLLHEERYSIEGARRRIRELRKEGGLKSYLSEAPALEQEEEQPVAGGPGGSRLSALAGVARALQALARTPLAELFRY